MCTKEHVIKVDANLEHVLKALISPNITASLSRIGGGGLACITPACDVCLQQGHMDQYECRKLRKAWKRRRRILNSCNTLHYQSLLS